MKTSGLSLFLAPRQPWTHRRWWMVWYCALSLLFLFVAPPFEAPDEPHHLDYVNFVATKRQLPNQLSKENRVEGEGHQPPLYYLALGGLLRLIEADDQVEYVLTSRSQPDPRASKYRSARFLGETDRQSFFLLRLLSWLLSAIAVWLMLSAAARWFADPEPRAYAFAFVSTLPQLQGLSGAINNDSMALLISGAAFYAVAVAYQQSAGRWPFAVLAFALLLAPWTKKTLLVLLPALIPLGWSAMGTGKGRKWVVALAVGAVSIVGLMLATHARYGDPLGSQMERETLGHLVDEKSLFSPYFAGSFWKVLFMSFVCRLGWMSVGLPWLGYLAYLFLALASALGIILGSRDGRFWFAVWCIALSIGSVVYYNLTFEQAQGRFLFPVLAPISWIVGQGMANLFHPKRLPFVLALLLGLNLLALFQTWAFFHAPRLYIGV